MREGRACGSSERERASEASGGGAPRALNNAPSASARGGGAPRDKKMKKRIAVTALMAALIVVGGGFLWARAVFTGDAVRSALAAQLAKAIGQPVTIGEISASAFPRVEIRLGDVAIGSPVRVRLADLRVGTDVRALLSRRIEHGSVRLNGARIELPLPPINMPERPNEPSGR